MAHESFRANAEGESESLRDRVGGFLDRLMKRSAGVAEDLDWPCEG